MSVAVLWRGTELDWETLRVEEPEEEEEGPTRAVLGRSFALAGGRHWPLLPCPFGRSSLLRSIVNRMHQQNKIMLERLA
jgi:hypothetical protein